MGWSIFRLWYLLFMAATGTRMRSTETAKDKYREGS